MRIRTSKAILVDSKDVIRAAHILLSDSRFVEKFLMGGIEILLDSPNSHVFDALESAVGNYPMTDEEVDIALSEVLVAFVDIMLRRIMRR